MHFFNVNADFLVLGAYLLVHFFGRWFFPKVSVREGSVESYFLSGRKLSLPFFVFSLVSTWYGGVFGVGEAYYQAGLSRWGLLAAPYSLFALLFAIFWVKPLRQKSVTSLPALWREQWGVRVSQRGALLLSVLSNPAPYLWMLGVWLQTWIPLPREILFVAVLGWMFFLQGRRGFQAVYYSNTIDFFMMFGGFACLAFFSWKQYGGIQTLWQHLPETHMQWIGEESWQVYLTWGLIAAWTWVDPGFHQRVQAARSAAVARWGLFLSVLCWLGFDFLAVVTALYAKAYLPALAVPASCYEVLGAEVLPRGIRGFFEVGLFALIFSTLNSFSFVSQQLWAEAWGREATSWGPRLWVSGGAFLLAMGVPSAVELWWLLGNLCLPSLLFILGLGFCRPSWISEREILWGLGGGCGVAAWVQWVQPEVGVPFLASVVAWGVWVLGLGIWNFSLGKGSRLTSISE